MPTKTTKADRKYEVDGKRFTWHPLPDEEGDALPDVMLPLRMKWKLVKSLVGRTQDVETAVAFVDAVAPSHVTTLDEMDVNDIMEMFAAWQDEYNALTGATLGESEGSSS